MEIDWSKKQVVVIMGPTASGKTALSIQLAKAFQCAVLSFDSRQFYREMFIGSAVPTLEERDGIPHFFIHSHSVNDELNAANFADEARTLMSNYFKTYDTLILTGGSGMFLDALLDGLDDYPVNPKLKAELESRLDAEGLHVLVSELEKLDASTFQKVDRQNPMRVVRALEIVLTAGKPIGEIQSQRSGRFQGRVTRFFIHYDRSDLYDRINQRVDNMVENGLEEEVRSCLPLRHLKALNTVGYSEYFDFFDGKTTHEVAIEKIKQHTRNYAKRQMTWLRRYNDIIALNPYGETTLLEQVMSHLKS